MNEFNDIINGSKPTLVDFFATWCGPCKIQSPILEDIKNSVGDRANIIKIDIDKNQELSRKYQIQSVPTLMIFKNGNLVWRESGVHQASDLEAKIKEFE